MITTSSCHFALRQQQAGAVWANVSHIGMRKFTVLSGNNLRPAIMYNLDEWLTVSTLCLGMSTEFGTSIGTNPTGRAGLGRKYIHVSGLVVLRLSPFFFFCPDSDRELMLMSWTVSGLSFNTGLDGGFEF